MKLLQVLRHAKSSWKSGDLDDHNRPLNERGKRDAPRMGRLLREIDQVPDLILCSTAKRARQTAERVAEACGYEGEIVYVAELYASAPETLLSVASERGGDAMRVMLVAHNPGMELLVDDLAGREESMPTAALAAIALPINAWSELSESTEGDLVGVWRPRELGGQNP